VGTPYDAKELSMSEASIQTFSPGSVVSAVFRQLNGRNAGEAIASFALSFRFKDHGIGLEFSDQARLAEFFEKTRELYPDYSLQTDKQFVIGDHVITQWTLDVTITEPFRAGLSRRIPISISVSQLRELNTVRSLTGQTITTA
jgi:hypothetical protein